MQVSRFSVAAVYLTKMLTSGHSTGEANVYSASEGLSDVFGELSDRIEISNPGKLGNTLKRMIDDGRNCLQVISDFDQTLTKTHHCGKPVDCSWGVLDNSPFVPEEYRNQAKLLKEKYYPIEIDPNLTVEEKVPHIIQWFQSAHDNLVKCGIQRKDFTEMVSNSSVILRDGVHELFEMLNEHSTPLLIFSAGIGDLIKEIILQQSKVYPNAHIISNFLKFNEQGTVVGFEGNLIHVYNKNESIIKSSPYYKELNDRKNIILLGDTLSDIHMVEGANCNNLIKIGFLNHQVNERLDSFKNHYDVVLKDDQTMRTVIKILKAII